jgi:hypothetical protein
MPGPFPRAFETSNALFADCAVALFDRRFKHGVRTCVSVRDRDAAELLAGADVGITLVIVFPGATAGIIWRTRRRAIEALPSGKWWM